MALCFGLFIIPICVCAPFARLHSLALQIHRIWAVCFFKLSCIRVDVRWAFQPQSDQQYILCANHFSYLDIPALGLFPFPFKFVGKSQLAGIPLFGYMYTRIHVTVNRQSVRSRGQTLAQARAELERGFNLAFFPEGGILLSQYPQMVPFKDGAFRLAAEKNLPIVPVSLPTNYQILADDDFMNIKRTKCAIIYHPPVYPKGSTEADIKQLKKDVFDVLQNHLNTYDE